MVLKEVTVDIPPGAMVGVVGRSGSVAAALHRRIRRGVPSEVVAEIGGPKRRVPLPKAGQRPGRHRADQGAARIEPDRLPSGIPENVASSANALVHRWSGRFLMGAARAGMRHSSLAHKAKHHVAGESP